MKFSLLIFFIFLLQLYSQEFLSDGNYTIITVENIELAKSHFPHLLIFFEGRSRDSQKFDLALSRISSQKSKYPFITDLTIGKIDLKESIPLRKNESLTHLPTLRLYKGNSSYIEYIGGKTEEALLNWFSRKLKETPPISKLINDLQSLDEFILKKEIVFIYLGSVSDQKFEYYISSAEKSKLKIYAHSDSYEIYERFNIPSENTTIICIDINDRRNTTFTHDWELKNIEIFFSALSSPSYFTNETVNFNLTSRLFSEDNSFMILAVNSTSHESIKAINEYLSVKEYIGDKIILTIFDSLNPDDRIFNYLDNLFMIDREDVSTLPSLVIVDREKSPGENVKYKMFGGILKDTIIAFYKNWKANILDIFYKSLPAEIMKNNGSIIDINHELFMEKVINNTQDVMVMFYQHSCKHCDDFLPVYRRISDSLENNKNLLFTMMDIQYNDVPKLKFDSVPQLHFFPKNDKKNSIAFREYRDESRFIEFLKEHTSYPWVEIAEKTEL